MAAVPKPKGRGALLEKLRAGPGPSETLSQSISASAEPGLEATPIPRGRGALLEKMRRSRELLEEGRPGVPVEELEKPKARGRAALLAKMQELKIGASKPSSETTPTPSMAPSGTPAAKAAPPRRRLEPEEEYSDRPVTTFMGTSGTPIHMTANYLHLAVDKNKGVHEYEVIFSMDLDNKNVRYKVLRSREDVLGTTREYDGGSCLYLPFRFENDRTELECVHPIDGTPFTMTLVYKKQKKLGETLHLFNTMIRKIMRILLMFQFNRNYFDMKASIFLPQQKLEILPGFVTAIDEYEGGLMLCLDTQFRVLRTQTVYELLTEVRNVTPERYKEEVHKLVLGSTVLTRYNNKTYIVDDIQWDQSPSNCFQNRKGDSISYMEYFKSQHNITIKDPHQPLLLHKVSIKKSGTDEKEDRLICLIPELCNLTGLTDEMRADFKVMKDVAQYTRITPQQRVHALQKYLQRVEESPEAQKVLSDWGLRLADTSIDLQGRVLNPEKVFFKDGRFHTCDNRVEWNSALSKNKVVLAVDLNCWIIVHTGRDTKLAQEFAKEMINMGPVMGCSIARPTLHEVLNDRTMTIVKAIEQIINNTVQCLVFLCPSARNDLYSAIKKICCYQYPVASQVILCRTLSNQKRFRTVVQKVAYQINCKLGGVLWGLNFPVKQWMVIGIDIYHSAGSKHSWLGFVSTLNDDFTRYCSQTVQQTREMSDFIKICFSRALDKYHEIWGCYPNQVVVYRDGTGDGQLPHILNYEVGQMKEVLASFSIAADICMIVVQKRINTRMFAKTQQGVSNPAPGSILDHTVTRRHYQDFFLVSQHVNQGTVTPTHYVVLYNSSNLKPDVIQKLTFKLCHLYYNWAGTIRVPAPCQYAHKLAGLVGQYIGQTPNEKLNDKLYYL